MSKNNGLPVFLAGLGIGAAVALLVMPTSRGQFGSRVRKSLRSAAGDVTDRSQRVAERMTATLSDTGETLKKGEKTMSDVKEKVKDKIDDAADATKDVVAKVVDQSKEAAHEVGKKLEQGGKSLQNV
jgi:gas vesicle protein